MATAKGSDLVCTQYDNSVAENAGLLKMDFLGLKTLTLIKDAVKYIEQTKGIKLNPEEFPLDDKLLMSYFKEVKLSGYFSMSLQVCKSILKN